MYYWIKTIATELGSIMLEHVALFPDPSTNNIDHAPHDVYIHASPTPYPLHTYHNRCKWFQAYLPRLSAVVAF